MLCIALFLCGAHQIDQLTPLQNIHGLYQSSKIGTKYYNAQFYGTEFYIELVERNKTHTIMEGNFRAISKREGVYLLENGPEVEDMLVTLDDEGFYFFDVQQQTIIYLVRKN